MTSFIFLQALNIKKATLLAIAILGIMLALLLSSMRNDAPTFDETAHIAAGFGYITQRDYRLNPEHPPLLKILAALSAKLAAQPHFPTNTAAWQEYNNNRWWLQFDQGHAFLYESGNNPNRIVFWARLPTILLSLLLGWMIFQWTAARYEPRVALLALTLYAFSPTVLAHSRYVTTDIAASFGFFIGFIGFLRFLEKPTARRIIAAGFLFGAAQLLKFSLIMLIPIYGILLVGWVWAQPSRSLKEKSVLFGSLAGKTILISIVGIFLIWIAYMPFVWNYPQERQLADAASQLSTNSARALVKFDLTLIRNKFTRPLGQYMLGVLMANQRAAGGNTTFFLGEVTSKGSTWYFPLLYLVKESLALHALTLLVLVMGLYRWRTSRSMHLPTTQHIRAWIHDNFPIYAMIVIITIYWVISLTSPLNIGIRHVLPTFPFLFILISLGCIKTHIHRFLITGGMVWMLAGALWAYPYYLSYYNIFAGGTEKGYAIATDSNYDWGQDFYRLVAFVKENDIEHVAIDYFGGASPAYYLGKTYEPWWSAKGKPQGWFAISVNALQGAHATIGAGFSRKPEESYDWLRGKELIGRAGTSIFIYKF